MDPQRITLLGLKLFLSQFRPWTDRYQYPNLVQRWIDLSQDHNLQCGWAKAILEDGHFYLLVIFPTIQGTVFFDPYTGNQLEIRVGYPFPMDLVGVDKYCLVISIRNSLEEE